MDKTKNFIIDWNQKTSERQKIQHVYLVITVIGALGAGMIALVDPDLGHNVVQAAFYAFLVFIANAVVWNLLNSVLISKFPTPTRSRRK